ncbi:hypothetical protein D3C76_783860 [compost metagenome]
MTAAHIRHLGARLQLGHHTLQCRQPIRYQEGAIPRPEKPLGTAEHARVVIAPSQPAIAAHGGYQLVLVMEQRRHH